MTLSDIDSDVRGLISDAEYDLSLIAQAANGFVNELFTNTNTRLMEAEDDIFISAGDVTVDLPDDIKVILGMNVTSPQVYDILNFYTEYGDFMKRYPQYASSTPVQIFAWTDFANQMRLGAPALTDTTVHLDYIRNPVDMVDPASICEVPDPFRVMVAHGTLAFLMEINEDYAEAQSERGLNAPRITSFIKVHGRGGIKSGPTIMRTNRKRYGTYGGAASYWP